MSPILTRGPSPFLILFFIISAIDRCSRLLQHDFFLFPGAAARLSQTATKIKTAFSYT